MDGVTIYSNGKSTSFDQVIIATHADQALKMLATPSNKRKSTFGTMAILKKTQPFYTRILRLHHQNERPGHLGSMRDQMMTK